VNIETNNKHIFRMKCAWSQEAHLGMQFGIHALEDKGLGLGLDSLYFPEMEQRKS
jgi:hypothetical protein